MKKINNILGILAASAALTACVGDLNVTPIDPNANTVDKVLTDKASLDSYIETGPRTIPSSMRSIPVSSCRFLQPTSSSAR